MSTASSLQTAPVLLNELAKLTHDLLTASIAEHKRELLRHRTLKRDVEMNGHIYELMLQGAKEVNYAEALRTSNARIVDRAVPAEEPIKPNRMLLSALGLGAGFLLGIVFAFVRTIPVMSYPQRPEASTAVAD